MSSKVLTIFQVTTDRGKHECAIWHGGTSAAAPNAVGVFALALQARSVFESTYVYITLLNTFPFAGLN